METALAVFGVVATVGGAFWTFDRLLTKYRALRVERDAIAEERDVLAAKVARLEAQVSSQPPAEPLQYKSLYPGRRKT